MQYGIVHNRYGSQLTPKQYNLQELARVNQELAMNQEIIDSLGPIDSPEKALQYDSLKADRSRLQMEKNKYETLVNPPKQKYMGLPLFAIAAGISYYRNKSILRSIGAGIISPIYLTYVAYDAFKNRKK